MSGVVIERRRHLADEIVADPVWHGYDGTALQRIRISLGLSEEALGRAAGLTDHEVRYAESGKWDTLLLADRRDRMARALHSIIVARLKSRSRNVEERARERVGGSQDDRPRRLVAARA